MVRLELVGIKVPDREKLVRLYHDIADAVKDSESTASLATRLHQLWLAGKLPLNKQALAELLKALPSLVEEWDDPEYGPTLLGTNRVFAKALQLAGRTVFELDRAVAVVVPGQVIYRFRPTKKAERQGEELHKPVEEPALVALVFSDPDSGVRDVDEVAVTGYRFGADAVLFNDRTLEQVHGDSLDEAATHVSRLRTLLSFMTTRRAKESREEYELRQARVAGLEQCLDTILGFLTAEAEKGWL